MKYNYIFLPFSFLRLFPPTLPWTPQMWQVYSQVHRVFDYGCYINIHICICITHRLICMCAHTHTSTQPAEFDLVICMYMVSRCNIYDWMAKRGPHPWEMLSLLPAAFSYLCCCLRSGTRWNFSLPHQHESTTGISGLLYAAFCRRDIHSRLHCILTLYNLSSWRWCLTHSFGSCNADVSIGTEFPVKCWSLSSLSSCDFLWCSPFAIKRCFLRKGW